MKRMDSRRRRRRNAALALGATLFGALVLAPGCVIDQSRAPAPVVLSPKQRSYGAAGEVFAARGPQAGQRLQSAWVVGLDGLPVDLRTIGAGRPTVIVTASFSSNVARRSQAGLELLHERFGDSVQFVTLYTLEAHPSVDLSPYSGTEWVPAENVTDDALVRQPTVMFERMELARRYQQQLDVRTLVVVDPMDNVGWRTLGMGPNLAVIVDADGVVAARQGWFDPVETERLLEQMTGRAPTAATAATTTAGAPGSAAQALAGG